MTTLQFQPDFISSIYVGRVMHRRIRPFLRRFSHNVFSLYVDLDELPVMAKRLLPFSHNRWNLVSFMDRDHGPRDGTPLRPWAINQLKGAGIDEPCGPIRILSFPRMFGHVFNPLSIWFCHRAAGGLLALIYEVKNRRGQQHCYVFPVPVRNADEVLFLNHCEKSFYVSPFIPISGRYRFRMALPGSEFRIGIVEGDCDGTIMTAVQSGRRQRLSTATLLLAALRFPALSVKVVTAIHWHALVLWLRGAPRFTFQAGGTRGMSPRRELRE